MAVDLDVQVLQRATGADFGLVAGHDQVALLQEHQAVHHVLQLVHQVGGDQHRAARLAAGADGVDGLGTGEDVHAVERLVEHHQRSVPAEGQAQPQLRRHARGQLADAVSLVQLHVGQHPAEAGGVEVLEEVGVVFADVAHRHVIVEVVLGGHVGHPGLGGGADALAVQGDLARGGAGQPHDQLHHRGLAAAVGSQQQAGLARFDIQRYVVQRCAPKVTLGDISQFKHGVFLSFLILECVSKCREMQFRGHRAAFQGEKPQSYWLQVKVFQHRNAA